MLWPVTLHACELCVCVYWLYTINCNTINSIDYIACKCKSSLWNLSNHLFTCKTIIKIFPPFSAPVQSLQHATQWFLKSEWKEKWLNLSAFECMLIIIYHSTWEPEQNQFEPLTHFVNCVEKFHTKKYGYGMGTWSERWIFNVYWQKRVGNKMTVQAAVSCK